MTHMPTRVSRIVAMSMLSMMTVMSKAAHAQSATEIWSGTSAGYSVHWTTNEIQVHRGNQSVFSAREWVNAGLAHFIAANRSGGAHSAPDCNYRRSIRIVAIVGSMMSLEDSSEVSCRRQAHPGGMTRFLTVDLAATGALAQAGRDDIGRVDVQKPERAVLLTRLFPTNEVFAALSDAPPLRRVLAHASSKPTTLPALLDAVADASGEGDDCFLVPRDLLAALAFNRLDTNRVVVRVGLPGDGPCRSNLTTADLSFATPPAIANALRQAAVGEAGFLAKRGEEIAKGRVTVIELRSGRGGGR